MEKQKYVYEATVLSVHDGDTIQVEIDLGFRVTFKETIRFYGLNAPELKHRNELNKLVPNPAGHKTLEFVSGVLKVGDKIILETIKDKKEKYDRYLANIYYMKGAEQVFLNKYLLDNSMAVEMKY